MSKRRVCGFTQLCHSWPLAFVVVIASAVLAVVAVVVVVLTDV